MTSEAEVSQRERSKDSDSMLLALKMEEEGAVGQRMQGVSRRWKDREIDSPRKPPEGIQTCFVLAH